MIALPSLMPSSADRICSTRTGWANRTWISVPPEKSMPAASPPLYAMWARPSSVNPIEIA